MKRENIHIVFVKPASTVQQCLSVWSTHRTDGGAIKAAKEFILTYPEGYYEIKVYSLKQ